MHRRFAIIMGCFLGLTACIHGYIPGTRIRNSRANREVVEVVNKLRDALQRRDADTILSLVSPSYFETNGTADPRDDYGYEELRDRILRESLDATKEMYVGFAIH